MSFPKGFLWGGDISANQCEGGWDEGGKSPNMTDYHTGGNVNEPRMQLILCQMELMVKHQQ